MASWWSRAKESFRKQAGAEKTRVEKHFEKKDSTRNSFSNDCESITKTLSNH